MAGDILSKKTRQEFREHFVGWTLRTIAMEFDAADVPCDTEFQPPCSGEHRSLVEQYYHAVDFADWIAVRRILKVYEAVLNKLDDDIANPVGWSDADVPRRALASLTKFLDRDGFEYEGGQIRHKGQVATLPMVREAAAALDAPELHRQLARLRDAPEADPGLAIGTAKELVETTCKTVLHARGVAYDENADVTERIRSGNRVMTKVAAMSQSRAHGRARAKADAGGSRGMGEAGRAVA